MEADRLKLSWRGQEGLLNQQTHDLCEHARCYDRWDMEIVQLSAGRFTGRISRIDCPHMQIFREYSNLKLLKSGRSWPGSLVFSLPIQVPGSGWMCGSELKEGAGLLEDGVSFNEMVTPSHLDVVFIALDRQWFMAQAVEQGFTYPDDKVLSDVSLYLRLAEQASLSAFLEDLFRDFYRSGSGVRPDLDRDAIERSVAIQLLKAISSAHQIARLQDNERKRLADAARQIFFDHLSDPIGFGDIARQLGISRRHLHNCFMSSFGLSGYPLLQALRLNKVRFELLMSRNGNRRVSIGDIAAEWGFWHQSRFAADYAQTFEELPSETLNSKTET